MVVVVAVGASVVVIFEEIGPQPIPTVCIDVCHRCVYFFSHNSSFTFDLVPNFSVVLKSFLVFVFYFCTIENKNASLLIKSLELWDCDFS